MYQTIKSSSPSERKKIQHIHFKQLFMSDKVERIDLKLAIDPLPLKGNFVHYDFLKLQYISHKTEHISPLRVEALSCNNNITYVTL